jgi:4-hydroxybenzoate polyprenyltransferase
VAAAWSAFYALTVLSLGLGFVLSPGFGLTLVVYLLSNLFYSHWLKHIAILDVLILASGFVLRVHAGTTLIAVERFSPWLYIVTTLFALFMGFGKRRSELSMLAHGAGSHRKVLDGYTLPLLDQFITIVSGATILSYALYTITAPNVASNHAMLLTIPFVIYGIFRYLFIIQTTHDAGAPDEVALKDRPLQWTVLLWGLTVVIVFYFFK